MKYCPFCGSGLQEDMVFCPKCGKRFLDAFENPEATKATLDINCDENAEPVQAPVVTQQKSNGATKERPQREIKITTPKKKSKPAGWLGLALAVIIGVILLWGGIQGKEDTISVADAANSVLYLEIYDDADCVVATASGFIIEDGMTLVTNYHVIDGAHHIIAYTPDGARSVEIHDVLSYDETADLAILKTDKNIGVQSLLLGDSDTVKQGDKVFAVGYPLGVANTLSDGVVSSRYLDEYNIDVLQITAAISSGSSGGALFNEDGQVVGVICASYIDGQNLNIAIAANLVNIMLENPQRISLETLYEKTIPTYTVQYIVENYEKLEEKTFYIDAWIASASCYHPKYNLDSFDCVNTYEEACYYSNITQDESVALNQKGILTTANRVSPDCICNQGITSGSHALILCEGVELPELKGQGYRLNIVSLEQVS